MPFRDPNVDPQKRCGGSAAVAAREADGYAYTKDRTVRWKQQKNRVLRYERREKDGKYKVTTHEVGDAAKSKDKEKEKEKEKEEEEEEEEDEEEEAKEEDEESDNEDEDADAKDVRQDIERNLDGASGYDFAESVEKAVPVGIGDVRFHQTGPITYAICSEITKDDAAAVNQTLKREVEPEHERRREFLRDLTTLPPSKNKDRPYHGDKPYLVKALTYQLCQDTFWPKNKYKQPFIKYTRLATNRQSFDSGRSFVATAGVRGLAPQLFRDVKRILGDEGGDDGGRGRRRVPEKKKEEKKGKR